MNRRIIVEWILPVLLILEIILTGFLAYNAMYSSGFCVVSDNVGNCESVQSSIYSEIFGVKLSYLGLIAFVVLAFVYFISLKDRKISKLFIWLSFVGALFALYLLYLQLFVLQQVCTTCLIVDGVSILIFLISWVFRK